MSKTDVSERTKRIPRPVSVPDLQPRPPPGFADKESLTPGSKDAPNSPTELPTLDNSEIEGKTRAEILRTWKRKTGELLQFGNLAVLSC